MMLDAQLDKVTKRKHILVLNEEAILNIKIN